MRKIEVGKPFDGPVPSQDGLLLEIGPAGDLVLLIQFQNPSPAETASFATGLDRYSLYVQSEPPHVAIWVFKYPAPVSYIDTPFHAGLYSDDRVSKYLSIDGNMLQVYILDGHIVRHIRIVGLTLKAVQDFHDAIKQQLATPISRHEYDRAVDQVNRLSSEEIFQRGRQYRITQTN